MSSADVTRPPGWADENRSQWVTIPVLVLTPITVFLFAIRAWARHTMSGFATEDWVLLVGLLFALGTDTAFLVMVQRGFGLHLEALSNADSIFVLRAFWLVQMMYKVSLQATKISLLLFYVRIFHHIAWFKKISYATIGFLLVYLLATTIVSVLQCRPIERAWAPGSKDQCIALLSFFVFNGAVAVMTDLIVLGLPLPLIWGLQLPLTQKLSLIPVFGIGVFIVTVSSLRLHALIVTPSVDMTYDLEGTLWTIIEFNLAIVCACLPSIRVVLVRMFPGAFRGTSLARHHVGGEGHSGATAGSWGNKSAWSRVQGVDRKVAITSKLRRDETSSEEIILEHHGGIKKTVRYDIEYGSAR
ncbi:hypothetical protein B0T16DRAFT_431481 [Cercophora newfieldiana]|uniref:Rhodopsin domain-containing protein n=1 Tax=Cercophora newfieldiana TaxID=92897 RepID=A0AA39XYT3_9PEZI|nr:hypothetical protein B0T16DRAFT_431481 [Cercophora newfieldiana]